MCSLLLVRGHESKSGAFLDRDGVINVDRGYPHCVEDLVFSPTAIEGIMALNNAGYRVFVISNQSGCNRLCAAGHRILSALSMAAGLAGRGVDAVRAGIDDPTLPLPPSFNRFQDAQDAPQGRTRTNNRARRCPRHSGTGWRLTWRGKAELALPLWIVGGANSGLCDLKEIVVSLDGEAARPRGRQAVCLRRKFL